MQSSVTIGASSISTASAGLKVWNGSAFATSASGFTITNLVPGTGYIGHFYLQNSGGVPLTLTAHVPVAPMSGGIGGDLSNVTVSITDENGNAITDTTLQALVDGEVTINQTGTNLSAGATGNPATSTTEGNFKVKFDIKPSGITGESANVQSFNFVITGTQQP
jgi:hypothetical protein